MAKSAKAKSRTTPPQTINGVFSGNGFYIDFPQTTEQVVWDVTYDDGSGCTATTTYTVNAAPIPCTYSISCTPTSAQLDSSGNAKTVVKVTTTGDNCDTHFTVNNGTTQYDGRGTGHTYTVNSARTYTFKCVGDTSKTCTFTVSEAPEECTFTCSDFLGVTGNTSIPATPTGNVLILSYEWNKKVYGGKYTGAVWVPNSHNIILGSTASSDWIVNTTTAGSIVHTDVSLPSSVLKTNTTTAQTSDNLTLTPYRCADRRYSPGEANPYSCSTRSVTIKQLAAAQTCTINGISVQNATVPLTNGSFTNKVTVTSTGNACSGKWYGYNVQTPSTQVTGNSGGNYTGTTTGTYRVHSTDDNTKTAEFRVIEYHENTMNASIRIRKLSDGTAVPTLTITSMSGGWSSNPPSLFYINGKVKNNIGVDQPFTISLGNRGALVDTKEYCGNFDSQAPSFDSIQNGSLDSSTFMVYNTPEDFGYELTSGGIVGIEGFECTN